MNKRETVQILAILKTAYPYFKPDNADALAEAWLLGLGDYSAVAVTRAARLHMETCKFFPTIADIRDKILRAEIVYSSSEIDHDRLQAGAKALEDPDNKKQAATDEYLENLCKFVGLGYPNEIEAE